MRELDQAPGGISRVETGALSLTLGQGREPAGCRVRVVRRRVDDGLLLVAVERVRIRPRRGERPLQYDDAGETEPLSQADDCRRDQPEILRDERQLAERAAGR